MSQTAAVFRRKPVERLGIREYCLVGLEIFFGIGAIAGGIVLAVNAGDGGPLAEKEWLEGSPFESYLIPGLFLAVFGGAGMLVAALLHLRLVAIAPYVSISCGALMAAFEIGEVLIVPFSPLQLLYFVLAAAIAGLGWLELRRQR